MRCSAPKPIELTESEAELYQRIKRATEHDDWSEVGEWMADLFGRLHERNAIPESRMLLFSNPSYAETRGMAPFQHFQKNGKATTDQVVRHPHFRKYLTYFIEGPDLPKEAVEGLCEILRRDAGTSGMVMDQYRAHARSCVRRYGLSSGKAATEFFRLGVEIGMDVSDARTLRDAAKSAR